MSVDIDPAFGDSSDEEKEEESPPGDDESTLSRYQWAAVGLGAVLAVVGAILALLGPPAVS